MTTSAHPDVLEAVTAMLTGAGMTDVVHRLPDGSDEAIVVSLATSPDPQLYYDRSSSRDYRVVVISKRESEEQAMDESFEAARLLEDSALDSANGSYTWVSTDVSTPRSINWDEAGFYVWSVEALVHTN